MELLKKLGSDVILLMILLLAAVLYGYGIWNDQYANTYYTTAVGSMLQSFHNFFFASLDSAGSVTVDKPPVTFWLQTLSALIFGLQWLECYSAPGTGRYRFGTARLPVGEANLR
jgi:4-amino-4-deoxy-L-arabinose transferase-like glycosyltransferase